MDVALTVDMRIRFDRGTLVLEAEHATEDPSQFSEATRDQENLAWRYPAHLYSSLRVRLLDMQVRISDELRFAPLSGPFPAPALRWYQTAAIEAWEAAKRHGVVALPTGSGKTHVALGAIASLAVSTLILVPTRVLLDQWARVLSSVWPFEIGRIGDGERVIAPITIATYASAAMWAPRIGDQFGLVIVDEAHHVGAWCPQEILEMLPAPCRLGLTATPPDGVSAVHLERFVGPTVYSLRIEDLTGHGLAEWEHIEVPVDLTPAERITYRDQRARFASVYAPYQRATRGSSWQEFVRDARRTRAGQSALAAWRSYRSLLAYPQAKRMALGTILAKHPRQRTLIFTGDNATAYTIARELLVQPITHEIGKAERADVLARFRAGIITALVSSQVLDEGIDVPDADIAIVVGGTASARRHVQRVGRVLRPRDGKRALVYELAVKDSTEADSLKRRHAGLSSPASEPRHQPPRVIERSPPRVPTYVPFERAQRHRLPDLDQCLPEHVHEPRPVETLVPGVARRRSAPSPKIEIPRAPAPSYVQSAYLVTRLLRDEHPHAPERSRKERLWGAVSTGEARFVAPHGGAA